MVLKYVYFPLSKGRPTATMEIVKDIQNRIRKRKEEKSGERADVLAPLFSLSFFRKGKSCKNGEMRGV